MRLSIKKIENFGAWEWLIFIITTLLLTDVIILLNIPLLREALSFLYFTIVPGILILQILRLNEIEFLKKIILSVGLSVAFLIFLGLFLNSLYPLILMPLSLGPVLVSLNMIIIILAIISYKRNKEDFDMNKFLNFKIDFNSKLTSPFIFPILLPFMMVLGTSLMNITQNNIILLLILFLIPIYLVAIFYLKDRINEAATYPIAIWMIGLSLLFLHGLTSNHIMGRDISTEFYCFQLTLKDFHWDISQFYHPYNACLSVTILPTIYKVLSNINSEYIFKLFFVMIVSINPLIIYIISKKYIGRRYAIFASMLFMFQYFFFLSLTATRQIIAITFFFLAILIILDDNINKLYKKILIILFIIATIFSHYSTAYVAFAIIIPILLLPLLKSLLKRLLNKETPIEFRNFDIIIPLLIIIFLWYITIAKVQLGAVSDVINYTTSGMTPAKIYSVSKTNVTIPGQTKTTILMNVLGIGLKSIPNAISAIIHDIIFLIIGLGFFSLIWRSYKEKFVSKFFMGTLTSIFLMLMIMIIPNISFIYGPDRLFLQLLIFLAPVFVIGGIYVGKIIKKPKLSPLILLFLLISLFPCGTYLQYHFYGTPYSPYYETEGNLHDEFYLYDQEIIGAEWINNYGLNDLGIRTDAIGYPRLLRGSKIKPKKLSMFMITDQTKNDYIYLGYVNVNKNILFWSVTTMVFKSDYSYLFIEKSLIYSNGGSEVWK